MTSESGKTRRRYGAQFKAMVLAQCDEPGMSVAQVAMSHGINDNVLHRWRQLARQQRSARHGAGDAQPSGERPAGFVPLRAASNGAVIAVLGRSPTGIVIATVPVSAVGSVR